jgi:hypothetical protein
MNLPAEVSLANLVATLEARARAANNVAELSFSVANDAYGLLGFRQALVFDGGGEDSRLLTVSGLARPTEDSPYLVWLRRSWPWLRQQLADSPGWFEPPLDAADVPAGVLDGWSEWWPSGVYALPLRRRSGQTLAWVCFLLDQAPQEFQVQVLAQLAQSWSYCWEMLAGKPKSSWKGRWQKLGTRQRRWGALVLALLFFLPIHQTALAPAEVVALDAATVSSPLDGVVKTIHVRPNQVVKAGQLLFSLDDTTLRNRLEVAQKSIAVADAELLATTQKAFDSAQSKGDLALLGGRAFERRAELAAVQAQLARIDVVANHDGVAVFGDPDDWLGRPVSTGERIMLLANPDKPGVLIHLPVADAIALEIGAPVKLFLTVRPLSPLDAKVTETSYQAVLSPEGVASYRLRAVFEDASSQARIGIRGTAKVYGGWVFLGYYLLRRPLATLREWSGW